VAILGTGDGSLEWITPTLYLRGRETQLFAVSEPTPGTKTTASQRPEVPPDGDNLLTDRQADA